MGACYISPTDPNRWIWDGEQLSPVTFGPCTSCTPPHEFQYVQKSGGGRQIVRGPQQQMHVYCPDWGGVV